MLHREGVLTKTRLHDIEADGLSLFDQREALLGSIREAVQFKYSFLKIFSGVLCKFTDNRQLGNAIYRDYGKLLNGLHACS